MSLPIIPARQEKQLQRFYERAQKLYGAEYEGHQVFLQHAAFPMMFSPDLLYQLWFNFRLYPLRGTLASSEELPNMVVSDLLLSGICQEVGFELYQIDQKLRLYLLAQLQADERFGPKRIQSLAVFLQQYSQQVATKNADPRLKEIHQQLSLASLHPRHAAQEIGRSLQKAMLSNEAMEQMRLTKLLEMLAGQDDAFESLLGFSQQLKTELTGQESQLEGTKSVATLIIAEEGSSDTILKLEVPARLRGKLKTFRDSNREGWTEALAKIEEVRKKGLKRLNLQKLKLRSLPAQLWSLTELEYLGLQDNQLSTIPAEIAKLSQLNNLNLSRNQLTALPAALSELKQLNKLLAHHNELSEFPAPILLLENLRHLDLGNNQISRIPDELTYISGIQKLYLNDNQLSELPENLSTFHDLEILQVQNNQITRLPEALQKLENLKENAQERIWQNGLQLEGNPIVAEINERWFDAPPADLLEHLFNPEIPAEESDYAASETPSESETSENYYSDFHQNEGESSQTLYALLIGIDRYGEDIEPLEGCENDARAMLDFLRRQLNFNGHAYQIMSLLNEKAHKENVNRAIKELLSQAGEGEEVLFYFAGYGDVDESVLMQKAPFKDPVRKLVLYAEGERFFSDFEDGDMRELAQQLDRQKAKLTTIIDAGFVAVPGEIEQTARVRHLRKIDLPSASMGLPSPFEKIATDTNSPIFELYAAKSRNTTTEMILGDEVRGIFTYNLIKSLSQKKGTQGLNEVFQDLRERLARQSAHAAPNLSFEHWQESDEPQFLGAMLAHQGARFEIRFVPEQSAWRLDAGYRDGLRAQHPVTGEMSVLDLFEAGVPPEAMALGKGLIGQVGAESVRARSSWIVPQGEIDLNPELAYVARLNRLPIERLRFHIDETSFQQAKLPYYKTDLSRYIKTDREKENQLYLLPEIDESKAQYFLQADSDQIWLSHRRDSSRPILVPAKANIGKWDRSFAKAVNQMIHLSKWDNILNLYNPNSQIEENLISLEIISATEQAAYPPETIGYEFAVPEPLQIRIRLHNYSKQPLYLGLLYLSSDLAISPIPIREGSNLLQPGESIIAIDGETASLSFSRRQQEMGQHETIDYFKLIASPEPFNPQILEMLDIERQSEKGPERSILNWTNTHSLLFDETEGRYQDWNTRLYQIKLIYPNPS
ncbi:MAG: caspase family protein [Bacteroidia bacterium]